jgi:signal transduction histidine kinase
MYQVPLRKLGRLAARRWVADVTLAVFTVGFDAAVFGRSPQDDVAWTVFDVSRPWQVVVGLLAVPILSVRRRAPFVVCVALSSYAATQTILIGSRPLLSLLVALYAAAAASPAARGAAALGTVLAAHAITVAYESTVLSPGDTRLFSTVATGLAFALLDLGAWGFGRWAAATRARVGRLEAAQAALAAQAVADERLRIARELHDIVAHSVTVMVLHAAGAGRLVHAEPVLAGTAMKSVEDVGKQAMAELRRLLLVLRSVGDTTDDSAGTGEEPTWQGLCSLATIDVLARQIEAVGVSVHIENSGQIRPLDPSVDLAAYRVIQEALTNINRHAGRGSAARVHLLWRNDTLIIDVTDDGAGEASPLTRTPRAGFGLIGLSERVKLIGGQLSAGPLPDGGYRVSAELPARTVSRPAVPQ